MPENLPKLAFLKKMCPKIWTIGNRKKIFTYFIQKFLMFHMCIFLFRKWSIFVRVYIPLRVNQQGLKSFIGRNNYPEPLIFGFTNTPPPPLYSLEQLRKLRVLVGWILDQLVFKCQKFLPRIFLFLSHHHGFTNYFKILNFLQEKFKLVKYCFRISTSRNIKSSKKLQNAAFTFLSSLRHIKYMFLLSSQKMFILYRIQMQMHI